MFIHAALINYTRIYILITKRWRCLRLVFLPSFLLISMRTFVLDILLTIVGNDNKVCISTFQMPLKSSFQPTTTTTTSCWCRENIFRVKQSCHVLFIETIPVLIFYYTSDFNFMSFQMVLADIRHFIVPTNTH